MGYRKNKDGVQEYYYNWTSSKSTIIQEDWFKENGYKLDQYPDAFYEHVENELKPPLRAYWAMLMDGDGTVVDTYIEIKLTTREPIQYLADLYGSSLSFIQHSEKKEWSDLYVTRLYGKRFFHFVKLICPYASEKKQHLIKIINKKEPNYHPPKIPMDFKKDPGQISIHMGMVAGLFDSEGSVGIKHSRQKYKTKTKGTRFFNTLTQWVHFTNTNLRLLRKIKKILESWPFTFKPKIYNHQEKTLTKNGKLQKRKYKLQIPAHQHLLFMALFNPILMIEKKKQQVDRFKGLKMVNERFFTSGKWNKKKKAS